MEYQAKQAKKATQYRLWTKRPSNTDEEVQNIAEKLAEELRNLDYYIIPYLFKTEEYNRGPFGILSLWSRGPDNEANGHYQQRLSERP